MTDKLDIEGIRELAEKATDGPWKAYTQKQWEAGISFFDGNDDSFVFPVESEPEDAAYITAANPQFMLNLLTEIDRLRGDNDALRGAAKPALRWMKDWVSDPICECEYGHTCGLTEREDEIKRLDEILNKGVSDE